MLDRDRDARPADMIAATRLNCESVWITLWIGEQVSKVNKMEFMMFNLEVLEDRCTPSTVVQQGDALVIVGNLNKANVVVLDPVGDQVRVTINGAQYLYSGVNQAVVWGG